MPKPSLRGAQRRSNPVLLSCFVDCFATLAMTGAGEFYHDTHLSDREQHGASAASVASLQKHGEAFAAKAADHHAPYAVGTDRTGVRSRDGARERSRSHHPAPRDRKST